MVFRGSWALPKGVCTSDPSVNVSLGDYFRLRCPVLRWLKMGASYLLFPSIPTALPPERSEIWFVLAGLAIGLSLAILWPGSQAVSSCERFR